MLGARLSRMFLEGFGAPPAPKRPRHAVRFDGKLGCFVADPEEPSRRGDEPQATAKGWDPVEEARRLAEEP